MYREATRAAWFLRHGAERLLLDCRQKGLEKKFLKWTTILPFNWYFADSTKKCQRGIKKAKH